VTAGSWVAGLAWVAAKAAATQGLIGPTEWNTLAPRAGLAAATGLRAGRVAADAVVADLAGWARSVHIANASAGIGGAAGPIGAIAVTHARAARAHLPLRAAVVDVALAAAAVGIPAALAGALRLALAAAAAGAELAALAILHDALAAAAIGIATMLAGAIGMAGALADLAARARRTRIGPAIAGVDAAAVFANRSGRADDACAGIGRTAAVRARVGTCAGGLADLAGGASQAARRDRVTGAVGAAVLAIRTLHAGARIGKASRHAGAADAALTGGTSHAHAAIAGGNAAGMTGRSGRTLHAGARIAGRRRRRRGCGRAAVGRDRRFSIGATNDHEKSEESQTDRGHGIASGASDAPTLTPAIPRRKWHAHSSRVEPARYTAR
jgi:hypothetical protein